MLRPVAVFQYTSKRMLKGSSKAMPGSDSQVLLCDQCTVCSPRNEGQVVSSWRCGILHKFEKKSGKMLSQSCM